MGRQGVVNKEPTAAATAQSSSSMPPVPPKHPKKRWVRLMESRPAPVQLLESSEVTGAAPSIVVSRVAAAAGAALCSDVRRVAVTSAGTAVSPRFMSARHSGTSATYNNGRQLEDKPLNLSTGPSAEVQLSRIVDRVVERMLKSGDMDSVRSGDPLRFWFTSQFENKQRCSESSSTASSPGPAPPPVAVGSPAAACPTPTDGRPSAQPVAPSRMMELTIGMSDTIDRVIETVYRQELAAARTGCEVTSNSSDCVNSTSSSQDCCVSSASVPLSSLSSLVAPALKRRQALSLGRPPAVTSSPSSVASSRGSAAARRPLPATVASPPDSAAAAVTMGPPEASRLADTATASVVRAGEETSALCSAVRSPNRRSRKNAPQSNTTTDGPKESYMAAHIVSRKRKAGKQGINRIQKAQATAVVSNGTDRCESELESQLSPAIQDKSQLPDQTTTP